MSLEWAPIFAFASFVSPVNLVTGLLVGMFAKKKWHLLGAAPAVIIILFVWSQGRWSPNVMTPIIAAGALFWAFIFYKSKIVFSSR